MMTAHPTDHLGDYALHILPQQQEEEIAAHIARCMECRHVVDQLEGTLGLLAYATEPADPPAKVEEQILQQVHALRKRERANISSNAERGVSHRTGNSSLAGAPHRNAGRSSRVYADLLGRTHQTPRLVAALGTIAALLALAVGLLGAQLHAEQERAAALTAQTQRQQAALALLNSPGAVVRRLVPTQKAAGSATATMVMDPKAGKGELVVFDLPQLPAGKGYEFWLVQGATASDATATPVNVFTVNAKGYAQLAFTSHLPITSLQDAGISVEPSGGVSHPDSPMIMLLAASGAP